MHSTKPHRNTVKLLMLTAVAFCIACNGGADRGMSLSAQEASGRELPTYTHGEDIVKHLGYTASYNHTTLCPNWVAWELTKEEAAGTDSGTFSFSRDPDVDWPKSSREDYSNSGWDKGHMAPRADMKWSKQALEESYYFTNICPQNHEMNAGAWRKIEELTRRVARENGAVLVVCGPIFDSLSPDHIGPSCVHVPIRFFKALAMQDAAGNWHTIGFLVDNKPETASPRRYAVSVDSVEAIIRRDLFPSIPEKAEQDFDWATWASKKKTIRE